jgi:hypothetical protein
LSHRPEEACSYITPSKSVSKNHLLPILVETAKDRLGSCRCVGGQVLDLDREHALLVVRESRHQSLRVFNCEHMLRIRIDEKHSRLAR